MVSKKRVPLERLTSKKKRLPLKRRKILNKRSPKRNTHPNQQRVGKCTSHIILRESKDLTKRDPTIPTTEEEATSGATTEVTTEVEKVAAATMDIVAEEATTTITAVEEVTGKTAEVASNKIDMAAKMLTSNKMQSKEEMPLKTLPTLTMREVPLEEVLPTEVPIEVLEAATITTKIETKEQRAKILTRMVASTNRATPKVARDIAEDTEVAVTEVASEAIMTAIRTSMQSIARVEILIRSTGTIIPRTKEVRVEKM